MTTAPVNGGQLELSKSKAFTVTFDRAMNPKKHGLQLFEDKNPVDLAAARFQYSADGRTFTIAYDFKPGKSYEAALNSTQNIGFASPNGVPLWPVRLTFTAIQQ
jgi:hypothetical protein